VFVTENAEDSRVEIHCGPKGPAVSLGEISGPYARLTKQSDEGKRSSQQLQ